MDYIRRGLLFIMLLPGYAFAQEQKGFEITGHLDGLKDGEKVLLAHFGDVNKSAIRDDSCYIKGGNFTLKGITPGDGPRLYLIAFDAYGIHHRIWHDELKKNIGGGAINLFLKDGERIRIYGGDINQMKGNYFEDEIMIEGSPSNFARSMLKLLFYAISNSEGIISNRLDKVKDSLGFDRSLIEGLMESKLIIDHSLSLTLHEYSTSAFKMAAIPLIREYFGDYHGHFISQLYESLDSSEKNSFNGKQLYEEFKLAQGSPMPEFILPTSDGKMIALKDVVRENKVTLVHFWASNSFDRDKYQQELRIIYKKYHSKGLEIIGVSSDSIPKEWKVRLAVEDYPWINVSDLKGSLKGGIVDDVYHEGSSQIPHTTNVLVDGNGRIICWDANGPELQWYLWKYLGD